MDISQLIKSISSVATSGQLEGIEEEQRTELFQACSKLKGACASPLERTIDLLFSVRSRFSCPAILS